MMLPEWNTRRASFDGNERDLCFKRNNIRKDERLREVGMGSVDILGAALKRLSRVKECM